MGRFPRVTHPSAARQQEQAPLLPLDLHVLGLPPAFVLSQDQTLKFDITSIHLRRSKHELGNNEIHLKQITHDL